MVRYWSYLRLQPGYQRLASGGGKKDAKKPSVAPLVNADRR